MSLHEKAASHFTDGWNDRYEPTPYRFSPTDLDPIWIGFLDDDFVDGVFYTIYPANCSRQIIAGVQLVDGSWKIVSRNNDVVNYFEIVKRLEDSASDDGSTVIQFAVRPELRHWKFLPKAGLEKFKDCL